MQRLYALMLKGTNPGSNICIVAERQNANEFLIFHKIYICLTTTKEGLIYSCKMIIGLDGCFLKGLMKGKLLVAVDRMDMTKFSLVAW